MTHARCSTSPAASSPRSIRVPIWMAHDGLENLPLRWSPDSRWLTWARARQGDGQHGDLPLRHDRREAAPGRRPATSTTSQPVVRSRRQVSLLPLEPRLRAGLRRLRQQLDVSQLDPHRGGAAAQGRRLAARRPQRRRGRRQGQDEGQGRREGRRQGQGQGRRQEAGRQGRRQDRQEGRRQDRRREEGQAQAVAIDLDGFDARVVVLPPKAGNYASLAGGHGQGALPPHAAHRIGREEERRSSTSTSRSAKRRRCSRTPTAFELDRRRQEDASCWPTRSSRIVEVKAEQKFEKPMRTGDMEAPVDPRAEWRQMFADAYRFQRDFFYDPGMHGVDWAALRTRYAGAASTTRSRAGTSTSCSASSSAS